MNDGQVIVQLVGPDMTGKTQIAKELAHRLGVPYFKASSERETYLTGPDMFVNQLRYADPRMVDFLRQTGHSVVFDRGYPCEFVYSDVMNRETDMAALRHVDRAYAELGTRIVVCTRRNYDGIVDDIDSSITSGVLQLLEKRYRLFSEWTSCECLFIYVDDEDLDREVSEITEWLQK